MHRLVAQTFVSNPNNLPQVNYKDGNKLNNNINNLEWVTNAQNTQHGYNNNLYHSKKRCHKVRAISKTTHIATDFPSIRNMCETLRLNRKTVTMILKGEKVTNNYDYIFEYIEESQETIENIS